MEYRMVGTTDLKVSELVFGGRAVGGLLISSPKKINNGK
jgi:aryl-alcohol dehydrogenase-like predicted oxidoreductase